MATKDLSFKDKSKTFINSVSNSNAQYNNLNLNNQNNSSFSSPSSSRSQSVSTKNNERKINVSSNENSKQFNKRNDSNSWKQSSSKPFEHLISQSSEEKSSLKSRSKSSNVNSSTLSLHIAAYENSIETAGKKSKSEENQISSEKKKHPSTKSAKKSSSTEASANFFAFPRQLDTKKAIKPETMPFKASQKLLTPPKLTRQEYIIEEKQQQKKMEDSFDEASNDSYDDPGPPPILNQEEDKEESVVVMETDEQLPPILEAMHDEDSKHDCGICHQSINITEKKEQFSAGGFKKGDSQKTDEWIHCDNCLQWFHIACANIEEFETKLMDIYHCAECAKIKGPSKMKEVLVPHRYDFWNTAESGLEPQIGTKKWIDNFIAREESFPEFSDLTTYQNGYQFKDRFNYEKEWKYPLKVLDKDGLEMKIPHKEFTVKEMIELVGRDEVVQVIDVYMQESNSMSMGAFYDRWEQPQPRERLYNMLSFEFSHTPLMDIIRAPDLMYRLSWVHRFWPPEAVPDTNHLVEEEHFSLKPDVAMFALLGMGGSYTDFHIDFGGSSVWYHVFKGRKVFYVIEPTPANLEAFVAWTNGPKRNEQFLNDLIPSRPMKRVVIEEGETLMIPSGWIHAVYTPIDSMVFGGNFVHELNITRQLQVYDIELKCNYDEQFLFPQFELTNWYAAYEATERLGSLGHDSPSQDVIEGFRTMIPYLKKWVQRDKEKNPAYKVHNAFRNVISNLEAMIKNYDKNQEDESYDPENDRRASLKLKIRMNGSGGNSLNGSPKKSKDKSYEKAEEKISKLGKKDARYVSNMFQKGQTQSGRTPKPAEWLKESVVGFETQEPGPSSITTNKNFFKNFTPEEKKFIDSAAKADDKFSILNGDPIYSSDEDDDDMDLRKVSKKKRKMSTTSAKEPKAPKTPKILNQQSRMMKKFKLMKKGK